jgi:PAP2 superfamily
VTRSPSFLLDAEDPGWAGIRRLDSDSGYYAIRETGDDGNAATTPDTGWTPLFATPAHPDYPSGHSCVSGAATAILSHEFGEHTRFDMTNDVMIGVTRSFRSFTDALEEVKNARVFAGIHFRTACDDGTTIGKSVAQFVLDNKFHRVH